MTQLHLHLLSDSTGETLEIIAKACLAQFDGVEALRHYWPMVRSEGHLDRVLDDIDRRPGLVLFTLADKGLRRALEQKCRRRGIHARLIALLRCRAIVRIHLCFARPRRCLLHLSRLRRVCD